MSFFNTGNRVQKDTPIVLNLVIINVLVFIAQNLFNKEDLSLSDKLAIHNYSSDYFEPYQIVTNMFAHGGIGHIFLICLLYTPLAQY